MQNEEKYQYFLGIDISKSKLDIYNSETGEFTQVLNNAKSIQKYLKTITPKQDLLVVIDLTGGYEQKAVDLFNHVFFFNITNLRIQAVCFQNRYLNIKNDRLSSKKNINILA